jgi:hypothetical protein
LDQDALRARFFLLEIEDEGVLVDRDRGGVFRLNRTACTIWASMIGGASLPEIVAKVARQYGIDGERAERDTLAALAGVESCGPPNVDQPQPSAGRWDQTAAGYVLIEDGEKTCEIDRVGAWIKVAPGQAQSETQARLRIRSVVTRVLALRGVRVLHASAVDIAGKLTVFTGRSGAGKTTTAHAFVHAGAKLVCEDLLVLAGPEDGSLAALGGEAVIRKWVTQAAAQLARKPDQVVSCDELDSSVNGEAHPIERILILEAERRAGQDIGHERLAGSDAMASLLETVFFASWDTRTWYPPLATLRALARRAAISRATMPSGVAALNEAARKFGQKEITAS